MRVACVCIEEGNTQQSTHKVYRSCPENSPDWDCGGVNWYKAVIEGEHNDDV